MGSTTLQATHHQLGFHSYTLTNRPRLCSSPSLPWRDANKVRLFHKCTLGPGVAQQLVSQDTQTQALQLHGDPQISMNGQGQE